MACDGQKLDFELQVTYCRVQALHQQMAQVRSRDLEEAWKILEEAKAIGFLFYVCFCVFPGYEVEPSPRKQSAATGGAALPSFQTPPAVAAAVTSSGDLGSAGSGKSV